MEAETKQLWTQTIGKLLLKQSAPAVIGMLVLALYNFVDSIFIGKYVGMEGLAATSIVFPIQMIIGAFAMAFGVGAASIISRSIGAKAYEKVWQVFGTLQLMTFGFLMILSVVWLCFVPQLLDLFGATPESMEFASAYMVPLLLGAVFLGFEMSNNNIIRSVGHATMSMKIMLTSAITNLILDFVFMKIFGWGMAGAAWATVISWIVSCGMMLWYYLSPKNIIPLAMKHFRIHLQSAKEIILIGLPSFFRQIVASATTALINNYLRKYGGTEAIAIYGIVYKVLPAVYDADVWNRAGNATDYRLQLWGEKSWSCEKSRSAWNSDFDAFYDSDFFDLSSVSDFFGVVFFWRSTADCQYRKGASDGRSVFCPSRISGGFLFNVSGFGVCEKGVSFDLTQATYRFYPSAFLDALAARG